jgi:hypothetical protein
MSYLAIGVGIVMIAMGVVSIAETPSSLFDIVFPAGLGMLFILMGLLARKEQLKKHAMHGAAMLSLLGLVLTIPALSVLGAQSHGGMPPHAITSFAQMATGVLCLVFLVAAVRSFIVARRARQVL